MNEPFLDFARTQLGFPFLLITCGLPASMKTETSQEIARLRGCPILRTDLIRLDVLKNEDVFDEKVGSNMGKRLQVYEVLFEQAEKQLAASDSVMLDATFVSQALRERAAALAARQKRTFVILQTSCPQEVSIARILRRTRENYESNAITEQAYLNNKAKFEAVDIEALKQAFPGLGILHVVVDTRAESPEGWRVTSVRKVTYTTVSEEL